MHERKAYQLIRESYGTRTTERSKVPLINHIDEGLIILNELNAGSGALDAYCLHPLIQHDRDLEAHYRTVVENIDSFTVMLAMEYRSIANEHLSLSDPTKEIRLSPLHQVTQMLIADKVQNRKDFELYHKGTHPRSKELDLYFARWLNRLNVSEEFYQHLCLLMTRK